MKTFALAAMTAVTALASTAALADNSLTYNLNANVSSVCGVYRSGGPTISVPFADLSAKNSSELVTVGAGSASYRCNSAVGFTRTISSLNSGKLVRDGSNGDASNSIPYTMSHGGGSGLGFAPVSLSVNKVDTLNGSAAFLNGQTGSVNFNVNGVGEAANPNVNGAPGTTVFAGNYADTVTISVTAL